MRRWPPDVNSRVFGGRTRRWGDLIADPPTWWYAWREGKPCSCYMCGNPRRYFGIERPSDRRRLEP
jgi:hypothetical protein